MTSNPSSPMKAHFLDALKGWPSSAPLDYVAEVNDDTWEWKAGMVGTLNASGKLVPGMSMQSMALFIRQNWNDPDVANLQGSISGVRFGSSVKRLSCLVATGGYELQSTEFVDGAYAPGDPLTAPTLEADSTNAGKLTLALGYYHEDVCGCVSGGKVTLKQDASGGARYALAFWPCFLPKNLANATTNY